MLATGEMWNKQKTFEWVRKTRIDKDKGKKDLWSPLIVLNI